ncbi:hypothetical protein KIH39_19800 [Telmatocola sphagniphila]|uniref:Uncharacterized protein n=1 Tax=Telmatocola sphagniphila TaxID=1123043 RepID=A0A8E6EUC1_9BACT|nr:hypothetical protein [Telmatocola sphagniphila]QVL31072.1 hypothetical protein KIH39_19800 [Telmatocola sphagniphila]
MNDPTHSSSLSPEKLQMFIAGLSGMAPEEVRKAKLLYIRNAISEYEAMKTGLAGFSQPSGCLSILPGFGKILGMQKQMVASQMQLAQQRIRNAIDVWKDDLKGERFHLEGEEIFV